MKEHVHNEKCEWGIDLGIPFNNDRGHDALELGHEIEALVGLPSSGGGGGFGYRDLQWEGLTEANAGAIHDAVAKFLRDALGKVNDDSVFEAAMANGDPESLMQPVTPLIDEEQPVAYITTMCITENNEESYIDYDCDSQLTFGTRSSDPSGSSCVKHNDFHEDKDNNDMHVGRNPYDPEGWVRWQGGGYCAGDLLPVRNIQFDGVVFDYEAYRQDLHEKVDNV